MIGVTLAAAVLSACAPACVPGPSHLAPCTGAVVTVRGDDPIGCDVTPPQRLDVLEVSRLECDDMGGTFVAPDTCERVDY